MYSATLEHHFVFCQSAGLVGEEVLNLPQVLGDVERPALYARVQLLAVQRQVLLDEVDLA